MPLVELFYYADGDCEFGCAAAVDEVHSVGHMIADVQGVASAGDSVDEDMCAALGLVLCSASGDVPVCVVDDSDCSGRPSAHVRPVSFAEQYEATYT
eukprot:COSAG06_NODE_51963_length_308_cov_5.679426_1_plen_96_part_01